MPLNSDHAEPWLPEMQATKKHLNLEGHAAFKKSMHVSRCKLYHALFQPCTTLWMKAGLSILDRDFNAKSFFLGFFHFQGFLCADYTTLGIKQKMSFDEHSKLTWIINVWPIRNLLTNWLSIYKTRPQPEILQKVTKLECLQLHTSL